MAGFPSPALDTTPLDAADVAAGRRRESVQSAAHVLMGVLGMRQPGAQLGMENLPRLLLRLRGSDGVERMGRAFTWISHDAAGGPLSGGCRAYDRLVRRQRQRSHH